MDTEFWQLDATLAPLAAVFSGRTPVKLLSLDFFDTLVGRLVPDPTHVFDEVGRRLVAESLLPPDRLPQFRRLRAAAEARARDTLRLREGSGEVVLPEIWAELAPLVADPVRGAEIEVEAECEFCFVNPFVASLAAFAAARGIPVAVTSDTYLESAHLARILVGNGFDTALLAGILASSEHRFGKHDGRLFETLSARFGARPAHTLHVGDHLHSDLRVPRARGIVAHHYPLHAVEMEEIIHRERQVDRGAERQPMSSDALRSLVQRLQGPVTPDRRYAQIGATVFGPALVGYLGWAADEFAAAGVRRVFALMREGDVLASTFATLAQGRGLAIDVVPIYVSRFATVFPAITEITPTVLRGLVNRLTMHTVGDFLDFIGVDPALPGYPASLAESAIDEGRSLAAAIAYVVASPEACGRVRQRAEAERSLLVEYIVAQADDEPRVGVLDLGYAGTIQRNLVRALAAAGQPLAMVGRYFATDGRATDHLLKGVDLRGYVGDCGQPAEFVTLLTRSPEILEQALSSPIGSTRGYRIAPDGSVQPVLEDFHGSDVDRAAKTQIAEGIGQYVQLYEYVRGAKPALFARHADALRDEARRIVERLLAYPTQHEALYLGTLTHDDNYGSTQSRPICSTATLAELRRHGVGGLYGHDHVYWPQGSTALADPELVRRLCYRWTAQEMLGLLGVDPLASGGVVDRHPETSRLVEAIVRGDAPRRVVLAGWSAAADAAFVTGLTRLLPAEGKLTHLPVPATDASAAAAAGAARGDDRGATTVRHKGAGEWLARLRSALQGGGGPLLLAIDAPAAEHGGEALAALLPVLPPDTTLFVAFGRGETFERLPAFAQSPIGRALVGSETHHGLRSARRPDLPGYLPFFAVMMEKTDPHARARPPSARPAGECADARRPVTTAATAAASGKATAANTPTAADTTPTPTPATENA